MNQKRRNLKTADENNLERSLDRVLEENRHLPSFQYFTGLVREWYQRGNRTSAEREVIVMGPGIPDELLRAAGVVPRYILGGDPGSCLWSDDCLPRDADPVSRSLLGSILSQESEDLSRKLFLVPLSGDGMRKMASFLIREGMHVVTVDIPPLRQENFALKKWMFQLDQMLDAVTAHTHTVITSRSLRKALGQAARARLCMRELWRKLPEYGDGMTISGRILVQNSYYYADDLDEWALMLGQLTRELIQYGCGPSGNPRILLMGSPVYFPNDKLPQLFKDAGLSLLQNADASTGMFDIIPDIGTFHGSVRKMAEKAAAAWIRYDLSSAYVINDAMRRKADRLLRAQPAEGVVFHILKGQLEGDYELAYFEKKFAERGIPVFRLETDYQYQDVEQLRIRMEAFSEMLRRRHSAMLHTGRNAV